MGPARFCPASLPASLGPALAWADSDHTRPPPPPPCWPESAWQGGETWAAKPPFLDSSQQLCLPQGCRTEELREQQDSTAAPFHRAPPASWKSQKNGVERDFEREYGKLQQ
ncbi:hypothetical protein DV515_00015921 [Chloebia gouldiae]|uniref:Uncharacterized protein n=1 Tax=Chloebia gouldiae TaxID=44316 RepID=A0A3L8RTZ3_CHLGU|nr:hypothetical protein DV515_00015921 [Chloebia gouldiae]